MSITGTLSFEGSKQPFLEVAIGSVLAKDTGEAMAFMKLIVEAGNLNRLENIDIKVSKTLVKKDTVESPRLQKKVKKIPPVIGHAIAGALAGAREAAPIEKVETVLAADPEPEAPQPE